MGMNRLEIPSKEAAQGSGDRKNSLIPGENQQVITVLCVQTSDACLETPLSLSQIASRLGKKTTGQNAGIAQRCTM